MLQNQYPRVVHVGDGGTSIFAYPFRVFTPSDMQVFFGTVQQTAGYTVQGVGTDGGGTVSFTVPPAVGVTIVLQRAVPASRATDFQIDGDFRPAAVNDEYDRLWAVIQQLQADVARALRLSVDNPAVSVSPLPIGETGKALVWASPSEIENSDSTLAAVFAAADSAAASAAKAAADAVAAATIANQLAASSRVDPVQFTLVEGTQDYDLGAAWPELETHTERYSVEIDGAIRLNPSQYSITSAIRAGRTLTLVPSVVTEAGTADLKAGLTMRVELLAVGLYAFRDESVLTQHIAPLAVTADRLANNLDLTGKVAAGTLPAAALASAIATGPYAGRVTYTAGGTVSALGEPGSFARITEGAITAGLASVQLSWPEAEVPPAMTMHIVMPGITTSGSQLLYLLLGTVDGLIASGYSGWVYTGGIAGFYSSTTAAILRRAGVTAGTTIAGEIRVISILAADGKYKNNIYFTLLIYDAAFVSTSGVFFLETTKPLTQISLAVDAGGTFTTTAKLHAIRSR